MAAPHQRGRRAHLTEPLYETIGVGYAATRRPDARIEAQLHAALGSATRVLNVGAGAGSYEPTDRQVVAVEPSPQMIAQRRADAAPAVRAVGGALPFAPGAFDGAMALLTIHHWPDPLGSLARLRAAVDGPVVVLTFDVDVHAEQWLVTDYFRDMVDFDRDTPSPAEVAEALGGGRIEVVPVPADCTDGFCHAFWRRPEAYLDPAVRAGISGIARQPAVVVERMVAQLEADLADGTWAARHGDLLERDSLDAGYRLVVSPA